MAALTENKTRTTRDRENTKSTLHVDIANGVEVFQGSLVYINTTTGLGELAPAATTRFGGVAQNYFKNDTGATTTTQPVILEWGHSEKLTDPGVGVQDVGRLVHGTTDDGTITLTAGAGTNPIGHLDEKVSDGVFVILEKVDGLV